MWKTSACGKVILLGEHAVVYGVPALCGALQGGVEVEAIPGEGRLLVPEWDVATPPLAELLHPPTDAVLSSLSLALRAIVEHSFVAVGRTLSASELPYNFVARFAIPTGAGLGSSAALSVALVRAVDRVASLNLRESDVDAAAFAAEKVFHGSPSGLDHTVAQRGGFGLFRRGQGLTPVMDSPPLKLCIGHTGKARDTKGRVARVAELNRENPELTAPIFARIGALVGEAVEALSRRDLAQLGRAMNENQALLRQLDVSCEEIERVCQLALDAGALGAKLTGGGGGGCVVALAPGREELVLAAWQAAGYSSFLVEVGGPAAVASPSPTSCVMHAVAEANTNIALVKYWGKNDPSLNLPAVPSLSLTLAGLTTRTEVRLDPSLAADVLILNDKSVSGEPLRKVSRQLDRVARYLGLPGRPFAEVRSHNNFPTAAGLASSASAFAALTVAAYGALLGDKALQTPLDRSLLSSWARQGSGSAARSLFGGLAVLGVGTPGQVDSALATQLLGPSDWSDLRLVIGVVSDEAKETSSTDGMTVTANTSPYFAPFVAAAPRDLLEATQAVKAKDLAQLGRIAERSALRMHASAMAADPGVVYLRGSTIEGYHAMVKLRSDGVQAYFTCDAGPHPKALTTVAFADRVAAALAAVPGVKRTIIAEPGEGARLLSVGALT
ncbi:MAG: diphosphomevalonate decarboxylase [Myxococcales bacterium]|nr:diphosphomevalonate decarboxylase [Myxococcales bacterium]